MRLNCCLVLEAYRVVARLALVSALSSFPFLEHGQQDEPRQFEPKGERSRKKEKDRGRRSSKTPVCGGDNGQRRARCAWATTPECRPSPWLVDWPTGPPGRPLFQDRRQASKSAKSNGHSNSIRCQETLKTIHSCCRPVEHVKLIRFLLSFCTFFCHLFLIPYFLNTLQRPRRIHSIQARCRRIRRRQVFDARRGA